MSCFQLQLLDCCDGVLQVSLLEYPLKPGMGSYQSSSWIYTSFLFSKNRSEKSASPLNGSGPEFFQNLLFLYKPLKPSSDPDQVCSLSQESKLNVGKQCSALCTTALDQSSRDLQVCCSTHIYTCTQTQICSIGLWHEIKQHSPDHDVRQTIAVVSSIVMKSRY